jgi:serine phosphatase RsbU (regulator of sigma subunit)
VAVGLLEDPSKFLSESTLQAHQGDVFVLYTDGITEARDKSEEMFTLRRLQESLDRHAALADAEKISASIIAEVTAFAGEAEQYDDMTLIVAVVE